MGWEVNFISSSPINVWPRRSATHLEHSAPDAQNCAHSNQFSLLLALAHQEDDIKQVCVDENGLLAVEEHAGEVLGQLVVVLELVTYRVQEWGRGPHMSCERRGWARGGRHSIEHMRRLVSNREGESESEKE